MAHMIVFPCSECGSELAVADERDWIEHQEDGSHIFHPGSDGSETVEGDYTGWLCPSCGKESEDGEPESHLCWGAPSSPISETGDSRG